MMIKERILVFELNFDYKNLRKLCFEFHMKRRERHFYSDSIRKIISTN